MATQPGGDWRSRVRQEYAFTEPTVELGHLIVDGVPDADTPVRIPLAAASRHGLVTGADGTGKTTTLRVLAEGLSARGVPAVLVELDDGLSGPAQAGADASVRATVRGFGPALLAMVLGLDDMQADALSEVFDLAAEQQRRLVDLADLQAVLDDLAADKEALARLDGTSAATVGAIARSVGLLVVEGAEALFGEPTMEAADLLRAGDDGEGVVSMLALPDVSSRPVLCAALLLWLLAELAATVPEGTQGPTLALLVDEAQLLFDDASKDLVTSVRQVLRSVRAKGIGVFLAARDPVDLHPHILRQLRTRIQHATAGSGDAVHALEGAAPTAVPAPYELDEMLPGLGTGEAVVTVSSATGMPTPLAWTRLRAPGPLVANRDRGDPQPMVTTSPQERAAVRGPQARDAAAAHSTTQPQRHAAATRGSVPGGELSSPVFKSYARSAASAASREIARKLFGTGPRPGGG
ncbi:MAG: helicase HerA-like domain-containing protein [Streptosporangiales bacterium]